MKPEDVGWLIFYGMVGLFILGFYFTYKVFQHKKDKAEIQRGVVRDQYGNVVAVDGSLVKKEFED